MIFTSSSFLINASSCSLAVTAGFATKSTAPAFSASNTLSLRELITTTGRGYWGISLRRNSIPFIRGSSTSKVMTSGLCAIMASLASYGSLAVATTWIAGSRLRFCTSNSRNTMESSTTNTLIGCIHPLSPYAFLNIDGCTNSKGTWARSRVSVIPMKR